MLLLLLLLRDGLRRLERKPGPHHIEWPALTRIVQRLARATSMCGFNTASPSHHAVRGASRHVRFAGCGGSRRAIARALELHVWSLHLIRTRWQDCCTLSSQLSVLSYQLSFRSRASSAGTTAATYEYEYNTGRLAEEDREPSHIWLAWLASRPTHARFALPAAVTSVSRSVRSHSRAHTPCAPVQATRLGHTTSDRQHPPKEAQARARRSHSLASLRSQSQLG